MRAVTFGSRRRSHGKSHKCNQNPQGGQSKGGTPNSRGGTPSEKGKSGSVPPNSHHKEKLTRKTRMLSDKEKDEYWAAGRCFNCGKEGHMSRNCPDNASMKSQGQGPPGASTFNVKPISLTETDSEEQAEVLESLPLGAICFGDSEKLTSMQPWPLEDWRDHYPYWNRPNILARESIGDCYSMIIDSILTLNAPFPGDEWYHSFDLRPELRFYV